MKKKIKNIVFDQGKVLLDFNVDRVLEAFFNDEADRALAKETVFASGDWERIDAGLMTEAEALDKWRCITPPRMHGAIRKMFDGWYDTMIPVPGMTELIRALKQNGCRCYLLSNTAPNFYAHYLSVESMRLLDGYVVSAVHRLYKPDPAIYRRLFDTYALDPEECFFVDDLVANVEVGRSLGMRGFVFSDFDVEGLKQALRAEGVKI